MYACLYISLFNALSNQNVGFSVVGQFNKTLTVHDKLLIHVLLRYALNIQ